MLRETLRLGDHNESLIPDAFKEWYPDEKSDVSEVEVYVDENEVHSDESPSEEIS